MNMKASKPTSAIDLTHPAEITRLGHLINGKRVCTIGDFRVFRDTKTARLALDFNKGTLELRFNDGYGPDAVCYEEEPEELAFYCIDTWGNVETWHAYYKARKWKNPKTDTLELYRPAFLCRVRRVPYDEVERAWLERAKQAATRKGGRKIKDSRPLPPRDYRGRDIRGQYSSKIWDLLPEEPSNRALAIKVISWARKQGDNDPTGFGQWKLLGESVLAKEAGALRKDWAKEKAKRRKG